MIKELVTDEAILSQPCETATAEDAAVAQDLLDTLASLDEAACLAANQIGVAKAVIVYHDENEQPHVMYNPVLKQALGAYKTIEGCLTLESESKVTRYERVKVVYDELVDGALVSRKRNFTGWTAELIQHMIDHCKGKLVLWNRMRLMIKPIMTNRTFLSLPSSAATAADAQTAQDLLDTLAAHAHECVGMAANMIGTAKRIIVFDDGGTQRVMFNPEIVSRSGAYEAEEGCLSLPGSRRATRHRTIKVRFEDRDFQPREQTFTGFTAQIIQHEIDHCNGILI